MKLLPPETVYSIDGWMIAPRRRQRFTEKIDHSKETSPLLGEFYVQPVFECRN
jgi:hypothetical protein